MLEELQDYTEYINRKYSSQGVKFKTTGSEMEGEDLLTVCFEIVEPNGQTRKFTYETFYIQPEPEYDDKRKLLVK